MWDQKILDFQGVSKRYDSKAGVKENKMGNKIFRDKAIVESIKFPYPPNPITREMWIQPGDPILKTICPCCGAKLEIIHGDDPGDIGVIGESNTGQHNS